jgi:hypothetical protein
LRDGLDAAAVSHREHRFDSRPSARLFFERHEPSNRPVAARDDKFLAALNLREQLVEMRLRFRYFHHRSQF